MSNDTPTAATPEELATQTAASLFDGTILTESRLVASIAAAIRQHSEALEARATQAEAALAASRERERVMREALSKPGVLLFLDGRNEHGSHVLPMPMQTADITSNGDELDEDAEAIISAAEAAGYPIGSAVWCEFRAVKGQYDGVGRCEFPPGWEFVGINVMMTKLFGWHADDAEAAIQPKEPAHG